MNKSLPNKRTRRQRTGSLTVEFALTLPVLLMILFAAYELGRANMLRNTAEAAAYEGARRGIVPGSDADDVRESVAFVLSTSGIRDADVRISPTVINLSTETVSVEIDVPMSGNTLIPTVFTRGMTFRGQCELNRELVGFAN